MEQDADSFRKAGHQQLVVDQLLLDVTGSGKVDYIFRPEVFEPKALGAWYLHRAPRHVSWTGQHHTGRIDWKPICFYILYMIYMTRHGILYKCKARYNLFINV